MAINPGPSTSATVPSRPRRRRRLIGATVIATAVAAVLGAGIAVDHTAIRGDSASMDSSASVGSSYGIHLSNSSDYTFQLTSVTGDNEGVPPVGDELLPQSDAFEDFEVTMRAAKTTTVTADYNILDASDSQIGTATIKFSIDAIGIPNTSGSFSTGGFGDQFQIQNDMTYTPEIVGMNG